MQKNTNSTEKNWSRMNENVHKCNTWNTSSTQVHTNVNQQYGKKNYGFKKKNEIKANTYTHQPRTDIEQGMALKPLTTVHCPHEFFTVRMGVTHSILFGTGESASPLAMPRSTLHCQSYLVCFYARSLTVIFCPLAVRDWNLLPMTGHWQ